ncbi:MAG: hypothetical protein ACT4OM_09885 [Actinomycetota bacterium]
MHNRHWAWVLGTATAGVVAGHSLLYAAVAPDPAGRQGFLDATGHSYWRVALLAGIMLGTASLAVLLLRHLRAGLYGSSAELPGYRRLALWLSGIQLLGFTALENLEQVLGGGQLPGAINAELIPIGMVIQVVIALVLSGLLRWMARAAEIIGSAFSKHPPPSRSHRPLLAAVPTMGSGRICEACRGRGPPHGFLLTD